MKIVYVLNSGRAGGVEQHVLDLVRGMVARNHEVFVVCPWGEMTERYFEAGAEVRVDAPRFDIDPFYIFRLVRFLREVKPDVFHVHQLKTVVNGLLAVKLCRRFFVSISSPEVGNSPEPDSRLRQETGSSPSRPPVTIAHIHTPLSEWKVPDWKKEIDIFINRLVTNWGADVVLALTEATKEVRIKEEGIDPEKIVVIPNGVDMESIKYQVVSIKGNYRKKLGVLEDTVLIGTLSRLTVEKGIEILIGAVSRLDGYQMPDTKYQILIGGSGKLRDRLEQRAQDLSFPESDSRLRQETDSSRQETDSDKIVFLGFIPDGEKFAYLSALDIFVFPSLAEGFGISLIEAMACGCACLVSDLPVLQEVGGGTVESFKTGDAEDLAERLAELINDPERRKSLGKAARKRVEKEFTMEKFWKRYEELYEKLISN